MDRKSKKIQKIYGKLLQYTHKLRIKGQLFTVKVIDGKLFVEGKPILSNIRITKNYDFLDIPSLDDIDFLKESKDLTIKKLIEKFINSDCLRIQGNRIIQCR